MLIINEEKILNQALLPLLNHNAQPQQLQEPQSLTYFMLTRGFLGLAAGLGAACFAAIWATSYYCSYENPVDDGGLPNSHTDYICLKTYAVATFLYCSTVGFFSGAVGGMVEFGERFSRRLNP